MMAADLWRAIRHAARRLKRAPSFAWMVTLTSGLTVGAAIAMAAALGLLRHRVPEGLANPGELARVEHTYPSPAGEMRRRLFSWPELRAIRSAGWEGAVTGFAFRGKGADAGAVSVAFVDDAYFRVLGVRPTHGRLPSWDAFGSTGECIISDRLWRKLGGDTSILGRTPTINGRPCRVEAIVAFRGTELEATDAWVPLSSYDPNSWRRDNLLDARLAILVRAPADGRATFERNASRILETGGALPRRGSRVSLLPIGDTSDGGARDLADLLSRLSLAGVMCIALVCANLLVMIIVRAAQSRGETRIRFALGMSQGQRAVYLLGEHLVLGAGAALVAALTAALTGATLQRELFTAESLREPLVRPLDMMFAAALALALVVSTAAWPLVMERESRHLHGDGVLGDGSTARLTRQGMLALQVAVCFALLAVATMTARSLSAVRREWLLPGADDVIVISSGAPDDAAQPTAAMIALVARLRALPVVTEVATSSVVPFSSLMSAQIFTESREPVISPSDAVNGIIAVSPGHHRALGSTVTMGRDFTADDDRGRPLVIAVSQFTAARLWPGANPIGRCLVLIRATGPCRTVIGVVGDVHSLAVREPNAFRVYVPQAQMQSPFVPKAVLARTVAGAGGAALSLVRSWDTTAAGQSAWRVERLSDALAPELRPWNRAAWLFAIAAGMALVVAVTGVVSVLSFTASQRAQELAVRRALGANDVNTIRVVLAGTIGPVLVGMVAGAGALIAVMRVTAPFTYGVAPTDPMSIAGAAILLIIGAVAAVTNVIRRALKVSPMRAIRGL